MVTQEKISRRSFIPTSSESEVNYHYKKRVGPAPITFHQNEVSDFILDDSNKRHFLWTLLRYKATEFRLPNWTDFQISVSNDIRLHRLLSYRNLNNLSGMVKLIIIDNPKTDSDCVLYC